MFTGTRRGGAAAVLILVAAALTVTPPTARGAVLPRSILKSYFETGDVPTADQFGNLIDSYIHLTDDGLALSLVGIGGTRHSGTGPNGQGMRISSNGIAIDEGLPASLGGEWLAPALHPQMEPLWAGQSGYLPLKYSNSTGTAMHYGFLQITMAASSPAPGASFSADPQPLIPPGPGIHVEYWAWETTPNAPITTFAVPEPTAALGMIALAALGLSRRRGQRN
jgi:hypothetical protein